jgi:hypothetical protein
VLSGISPVAGQIVVDVTGNGQATGAIAGMQIVAIPELCSMSLLLGSVLGFTLRRRR